MTTILVSGWNDGFKKVESTRLMKSELHMTLFPAKQITNQVMDGAAVEFEVPDTQAASLLAAMSDLGARCEVAVAQSR